MASQLNYPAPETGPAPSSPSITACLADEINSLTVRLLRQTDRLRKAADGVVGDEPSQAGSMGKLAEVNPLNIRAAMVQAHSALESLTRQVSRFYNETPDSSYPSQASR